MKLSMWMIANRLEALDPEIEIRNSAQAIFQSARRAYATNGVYVYQKGPDVMCMGGGSDYIRLKNMEEKQAFEIIQSVFDFYDTWNEEIRRALDEGDFELLVEKCWQVFHNPIILMDANRKVISMSTQYGKDELDEEWRYLCEFGYSSVNSVHYVERFYNAANLGDMREPQIYRFPPESKRRDCLFAPIIYKDILYGKLSVLEEKRPLNAGDMEMVKYITDMMGAAMERNTAMWEGSVLAFLDVVMEKPVDEKSMEHQLKYLGWKQDDVFRLMVFTFRDSDIREDMRRLVIGMISGNMGRTAVFSNGSFIVAIVNENIISRDREVSLLNMIVKNNNLKMGESFSTRGIENLPFLYRQSLAALQLGNALHPDQTVYRYYDYAIDYILEKNGLSGRKNTEVLYACHPDIIRLWIQDKKTKGKRIETLQAYLDNDRSLINTAQELYVHRSTLVYRIRKITDEMTCDITDGYTRDYMKISLRLLRLYGEMSLEMEETFI